tara:strand:- start:1144 stop:1527 length:384 start_codon:yes stop_codon:yes gene_type:complete
MSFKRERPWGWYKCICRGENYAVKKIWVEPNQRLSLQYHQHRAEHWTVVKGSGVVTRGNMDTPCKPGDTFDIGIEQRHRLSGGEEGVLIIEVQRGECREDDIIRLEDDYGRVQMSNIYATINEFGTE